MTSPERRIDLEGLHNARDLGGLPTTDGSETAFGGYVRSADLRFATEASLVTLRERGIRTVVDLRSDFETRREPRSPAEAAANAQRVPPTPETALPDGMFGIREPLDNVHDLPFWQRLQDAGDVASPRFFRRVIEEQPGRFGAVMRVLAEAPGGVLFHCAIGRDRTGLVAFLLLALADVEPEAIAADYELTVEGLVPFMRLVAFDYRTEALAERLAERGQSIRESVLEALDGFDAAAALRAAGLSDREILALRARLRPAD